MFDMQENLKHVIMKSFDKWIDEIKKSNDGKTVINVNQAFEEIFCRNILILTCGGDDLTNQEIEQEIPESIDSETLVKKKVKLRVAIHQAAEDIILQFGPRFYNPVNFFWR